MMLEDVKSDELIRAMCSRHIELTSTSHLPDAVQIVSDDPVLIVYKWLLLAPGFQALWCVYTAVVIFYNNSWPGDCVK